MASAFDTLKARGFVADCTSDHIGTLLNDPITVYVGFDPTADSLHLGHVVPIMALSHLQKAGHHVLIVVGGATGMVGDPSGRSAERNLIGLDQVSANIAAIRPQFARFLDFDGPNPAVILDNNEWISPMSFIDWLREVGKYFTINSMLAKESVSRRLEGEQGLTFTEFSYMTMQAYDFLHLLDSKGCVLQCGGTDQWGNIVAGIDLIRKVRQRPAFGMTFPLITTQTGEKFGKSQGNAVWLDRARTTPWALYQYLVRQDDRDVIRLLKLYTFVTLDQIETLDLSVRERPEDREAQRVLAYEVVKLLHGAGTADEVSHGAEAVYSSALTGLSDETVAAAFSEAPQTWITRADLDSGLDLVALLLETGLATSKTEARRVVAAGGVYVNNQKPVSDRVTSRDLASPSLVVLRVGKKTYHLVRVK